MKLLKRLRGLVDGEGRSRDPDGIYFYVRCGRCGQKLKVRADRRFDLVRDLDEGGYVLHKEMMDGTCFSLMYATVRFDDDKRIVSQEIEGGEFISEEEFAKT
jgi:(2Fe-2S) ferredoxin